MREVLTGEVGRLSHRATIYCFFSIILGGFAAGTLWSNSSHQTSVEVSAGLFLFFTGAAVFESAIQGWQGWLIMNASAFVIGLIAEILSSPSVKAWYPTSLYFVVTIIFLLYIAFIYKLKELNEFRAVDRNSSGFQTTH